LQAKLAKQYENIKTVSKAENIGQLYRHADPRGQWSQVAQWRIGMWNMGHGH